jgi:hypothetical protein
MCAWMHVRVHVCACAHVAFVVPLWELEAYLLKRRRTQGAGLRAAAQGLGTGDTIHECGVVQCGHPLVVDCIHL